MTSWSAGSAFDSDDCGKAQPALVQESRPAADGLVLRVQRALARWARAFQRGHVSCAVILGIIAGLLAVFLKNGIGWLRQLPWIADGDQGWEIRFVLPTIGLVLTHLFGAACVLEPPPRSRHSRHPARHFSDAGTAVEDVHDQPGLCILHHRGIRWKCGA